MNYRIIRTINGGHAIVDAEDYDKIAQHQWFTNSAGYAYRQGWDGKQGEGGKHWTIWMHREINQTPSHLFTDHINCKKNDNRKANLRTVNKCYNSTNRPKNRQFKTTSVYKGVSYHPSTRLWRARIAFSGWQDTTYHKTEQQAALDYNRMAKELFGEFAQINVLPGGIEPTEPHQKSSKYRGVGFHTKTGKWRAQIDVDGKTKTLGAFRSEDEAAIAYNEAAKRIRGERAVLNNVNLPCS